MGQEGGKWYLWSPWHPQQGDPDGSPGFQGEFFLSVDGNIKQIRSISQGTGEFPLGAVNWGVPAGGCALENLLPTRPPWTTSKGRLTGPSGSSSGGHSHGRPQVALQDHSPGLSSAQGSPGALPWRRATNRPGLPWHVSAFWSLPVTDSKASSVSLPPDVRSDTVLRAWLRNSHWASAQGSSLPSPSVPVPRDRLPCVPPASRSPTSTTSTGTRP